jgi:hypothetical protein
VAEHGRVYHDNPAGVDEHGRVDHDNPARARDEGRGSKWLIVNCGGIDFTYFRKAIEAELGLVRVFEGGVSARALAELGGAARVGPDAVLVYGVGVVEITALVVEWEIARHEEFLLLEGGDNIVALVYRHGSYVLVVGGAIGRLQTPVVSGVALRA